MEEKHLNYNIHHHSSIPLFQQIVNGILSEIREGRMGRGDKLPSISRMTASLKVAPGTVTKAYNELKKMGIAESRQGKSFFIINTSNNKINIFVLVDRLTHYKELLYNTLMDEFGDNANFDFNFYNRDKTKFQNLIESSIGYYHYYVIMADFNEDISETIYKIPLSKLLIFNIMPKHIKGKFAAVYQDFFNDINCCIEEAYSLLKKYDSFVFTDISRNRFEFMPEGMIRGFRYACKRLKIRHSVLKWLDVSKIEKGNAYLISTDEDLMLFIKYIDRKKWVLGRDIGLIAYDDTAMREILAGGITVISTDFYQMGKTAAKLIRENSYEKIANPCYLIVRSSL
jgi:DNA-binding transcriptional regulator YhcF (GntR family)